ncbi:MAG: hypothetical protein Q4C54_01975 [Clostridia bacterium]|nr:hypothetical protein [Clostridia bacterium]
MSRKRMLMGVWLISMLLVSLAAYTMYFVAQMRFSVLLYSYSALAISQMVAVLIYLLGAEKKRFVRLLYRLCCLASVAVIPAFVFIFSGLISQYHVRIPEAIPVEAADAASILPGEETTIYRTDSVYVFFPEYTRVDLECGQRPSTRDESITWCSGAAFQHDIELGFNHLNIEGHHAAKGEYYESPYIHNGCAGVVFYDGTFRFVYDDIPAAMQEAASKGGSGFMQFALIRDGKRTGNFSMPRVRSYRALCELNGALCIIDSIEMMHFEDFLQKLLELNVTHAMYMDMGAGWNYSWYRRPSGQVKTLFGLKVPWSHNWIAFRK